ncbi:MAG: hypothetical protein J6O51_10855 [Bacteroidales bacterium]|nr:hypothetical protein [Bacteroidales bacterium]
MKTGFARLLEDIDRQDRARLEAKLPSWTGVSVTVPQTVNLQQCSGESAARFKASLVPQGCRVADLTGGLGADSWAFALRAAELWYNERDTVLCRAVEQNFSVLGLGNVRFNSFEIDAGSAEWMCALKEFRPDVIYLDPARRSAYGKKLFLLEDCSPDITKLLPILLDTAPMVMAKLSPMADITMLRRRLEGSLETLYVVGAEGECKELLCVLRRGAIFGGVRLVEDGRIFEDVHQEAAGSEQLLFVPSPSMTKSGLGPGLCRTAFSGKLAPFGKFYRVLEDTPFTSSNIKSLGTRYPKAEVTARGVPVSSEELRNKMKTKPGGSVHIFACQPEGERRLLVCQKVTLPE